MKQVQFRGDNIAVYNAIAEAEDYYILDHRPVGWSHVCLVAVPKAAMTVVVVEEVTYKKGQRFNIEDELAILAQTDDFSCALIKLESGNRYANSIKVGNPKGITQEELNRMSYTPAVLITP